MINLSHEKCYGCQGCRNICPKDAISMKEDEYGYNYPFVDYDKCIKCGLCLKVCPELNSYILNSTQMVLAVVAKDKEIVKTTASGGFATLLSEKIIDEGGVVYGCSETNFESIGHIRVDRQKDLYKLKNSKYVHSDIRLTYREAKKDLDIGRRVLFTGTPCQISGLLGFLRKQYDNLITMDLVCHGVPPMKMLKEQVLSYPKIQNVPHEEIFVKFRWKTYTRNGCPNGIHFGLRTEVRSGNSIKVIREENYIINAYMRCFQTGISLRENCLKCPYARKERISDITVGDFWGLGTKYIKSDLVGNNGVSLLLINTLKGIRIFNSIKKNFIVREESYENAIKFNRCLYAPYKVDFERKKFLKIYEKNGLIPATKSVDRLFRFETNRLVRLCNSVWPLRKIISCIKIISFKLKIM